MMSQIVGWAKRSVPTIEPIIAIRGGHGAKSAFAHPTRSVQLANDNR